MSQNENENEIKWVVCMKKEWKKIVLVLKNLAANHPDEFCNLFQWDQMGVRALEHKEIAALFCENCRQNQP